MLQQSHLLLFSLAITNLLTGKIQLLPSVVLLIGFSQNLMPLSQPLAFSSSQPPSCILTYFPPGVEQKLTMSYLKQSFVSSFINLYMIFLSIWGPTLIIPFVIGCFLSACFIFDKSRLIVCEYFESSQSATYKKNRFHPQSVQPYKLETCITPLTSLGLIDFGFLELTITVGDTMNSSWLYSETAMWYCWLFMVTGMFNATSADEVAISRSISIQLFILIIKASEIKIVMMYLCLVNIIQIIIVYYKSMR